MQKSSEVAVELESPAAGAAAGEAAAGGFAAGAGASALPSSNAAKPEMANPRVATAATITRLPLVPASLRRESRSPTSDMFSVVLIVFPFVVAAPVGRLSRIWANTAHHGDTFLERVSSAGVRAPP